MPHPKTFRPLRRASSISGLVCLTSLIVPPAARAQTAAERLRPSVLRDAGVTTLPAVVVNAQTDASTYAVPEGSTATKTNTRLLDTPQAISIVPRTLIEDQGAQKLDDILKNVAGVNVGGFFGEWDYYRIRGFDVSSGSTYLDGLLLDGAPGEEPWGLERVEVVKGPASTLYGQGPLGGMVNLVSKKPLPENFADIRFSFGSFNIYEGALDAGLVLHSARTIYFRLNALYRKSDSFVDYVGYERIYVAPSLTWEISPDTKLTILLGYKVDTDNLAFALPARGTVLPNVNGRIPSHRYIGNPALGNDENERTFRVGYEFQHHFDEHVTLRQNFRYFWLYSTSSDLSYPNTLDADDRTLGLAGYSNTARYEGLRIDTAFDIHLVQGPIEHTLTAGVDYRQTTQRYDQRDAIDLVNLDLFQPDYRALPRYTYGTPYVSRDTDMDLGIYVQEQAKFFNRFTFTFGARYDSSSADAQPIDNEESALTPKFGLTWEVVKGVALYANYSRSYNPQWSYTDASGRAVEPEEGENWEAGVKYSLWGGKLAGMLSIYQLTRENVATDNLSTPDPTDAIVTGEQRSRGFEFEVAAVLMRGLELTANYSYIDAEVLKDNVIAVGSALPGVPQHSVNAWLKYTVQEGPLKGLGFGVGGRYYSHQAGDETFATKFDLPSYAVVDAAIYYDRDAFHAQVNFNNILDREYYLGAYSDLYVLPGEPFNVRAQVGWKF